MFLSKNKVSDFCIIGAGVAGISLASELTKRGASVCVIDNVDIAGGASGTPIALASAATGRYATKIWEAEACYEVLLENLFAVQNDSLTPFYKISGVLKPALDKEIASRMKTNVLSGQWEKGKIEWLDEKQVKELNPYIACIDGGVWLQNGITVNMGAYLLHFSEFLKKKGVEFRIRESYKVFKGKSNWEISFKNESIEAQNVIYTTGVYTKNTPYWDYLPIVPVKGQLGVFSGSSPLPFNHAVSALGYVASLDTADFVFGSTFEHQFTDEDPDKKGVRYLTEHLKRILPEYSKHVVLQSMWAGTRASTPNRMPIIGEHPQEKNMYVFTGLAAKGLLYSGYLAKLFTLFLLEQTPLPKEISIERLDKKKKKRKRNRHSKNDDSPNSG